MRLSAILPRSPLSVSDLLESSSGHAACHLVHMAITEPARDLLVRFFNHLFTIPFPLAALLFFFFGVVKTSDGKSSISDEMDGIRVDHDEAGCARSTGVADDDGSQGSDQDGRRDWVKAARRGATVDSSAGRDADAKDVMAAIVRCAVNRLLRL